MVVPSIRKLSQVIGVSHTLLNRYHARGKFREEPDGGFDVEKVKAALAKNTDISQPSQKPRTQPAKSGEVEIPGENIGPNSYEIFNRARAAKEIAVAKEKQLDLRQRQEELLEASEVEWVWTNGITRFANRLLLVPDKLAPRVAVTNDVLEIRALIDQEIRAALRALSETDADAA